MKESETREAVVSELASKIWSLSRDRLLINLRFLDVALSSLRFQSRQQSGQVCCDVNAPQGAVIYYDPTEVVRLYKKNPANVTRMYLHILLHCIFNHSYKYDRVEQELWDVSVDMAVENAALNLNLPGLETTGDRQRRENLAQWKTRVGTLTADRIYRSLKSDRLGVSELLELGLLFRRDVHERRNRFVR